MKKQHQNPEQPTGVPEPGVSKQENETTIAGATKKCPHCGENLPEKIAFCLYCMKPLSGDTVQKSEAKPQGNEGNCLQKRSVKMLIGAAALLTVVAIVVATAFITASILSRPGNNPHHQSAITVPTMPPDASIDSAFSPEPSPEPSPTPPHTQQSAAYPTPSPSPSPSGGSNQRGNRPSNPAISLQRAIEIGYEELERRGHAGTFRSDSGMDWEHGQWVWELLFRAEGGRLPLVEMYINVDTGDVVKFEWDD